jgi:dipeptide/tripeptide permease
MVDFNTIFVLLFIGLMAGLGVANFVEARKTPQMPGQPFFGLLFLVAATGLILYKMKSA